jgi:hypothetical protein
VTAVTPHDWLDAHMGDEVGRNRASADTSKLFVALTSGTAAILAALALAADPSGTATFVIGLFLSLAVGLALAVVLVDRRVAVDVGGLLARAQAFGWDEHVLLRELRVARRAALGVNESIARFTAWLLAAQVALSIATGVAAILVMR